MLSAVIILTNVQAFGSYPDAIKNSGLTYGTIPPLKGHFSEDIAGNVTFPV